MSPANAYQAPSAPLDTPLPQGPVTDREESLGVFPAASNHRKMVAVDVTF